jgi:hypothetical protein
MPGRYRPYTVRMSQEELDLLIKIIFYAAGVNAKLLMLLARLRSVRELDHACSE